MLRRGSAGSHVRRTKDNAAARAAPRSGRKGVFASLRVPERASLPAPKAPDRATRARRDP